MKPTWFKTAPTLLGIILTTSGVWAGTATGNAVLENQALTVTFQNGALVRLFDKELRQAIDFAGDSAAITVNGAKIDLSELPLLKLTRHRESLTFTYGNSARSLRVVYELKPGWRFISKQLLLELPQGATGRVDAVEVLRAGLKTGIAAEHQVANGARGVFLRLTNSAPSPTAGLFLVLQNPFMKWQRDAQRFSMAYAPEMEWRAAYGPFVSDRALLGAYSLSGFEFPARNVAEWKYLPDPAQAFAGKPMLDWAEFDALAQCAGSFVMRPPRRSVKVHVPWCENDYQVDVGTPPGRAEWKRIIDQAAAVGCEHVLFTPANREVSSLKDNTDAWGWENILWLGLGQKLRQGQWTVRDSIPPSVQEMLDYARAKHVKLLAYVYPTLGWKQNPEWTRWCNGKTRGYTGVDTGVRSFQDWFIDQLIAFQKRTGIGGYSFDHWWIAYEPKEGLTPTSKYAQWFGCRRILEELRRRVPNVVIDGRQQYQYFGPWTWLAGSYPHPTTTDEQPGSFENFPDLHFSRVSGDRQRWAAWWYRMEQFAPLTLVPGYMTHQTPRNNAKGRCIRDQAFRARDWDYLGWRFSILSSIGTAPFNHVVDLLPARDLDEFHQFRPADQQWLRGWMEWTDTHADYLRHLRPIIGPPVLGRVDGTAAIVDDRGFLFLFNPNYRELDAVFALDRSIGLRSGKTFLLRELYPSAGRLHGSPQGPWGYGDQVKLPIKGPQALVLELIPATGIKRPALVNGQGRAALDGDALVLADVTGEMGATVDMAVLLPQGRAVTSVRVNGRPTPRFSQSGDLATVPVTFAGPRITHCPQVGTVDPHFSNKIFRAELTIPQPVFTQLAQRRNAWPIPYTQDDLLATWLGSDRLLLYVHIADPDDRWTPALSLDGKPFELKKAYSDIYPNSRQRTFTGFYADISALPPDTPHAVELTLPDLQPGQFQGIFLENVAAEFTSELAR